LNLLYYTTHCPASYVVIAKYEDIFYKQTSNLLTQPRQNQKTSNLTTREPLTSNLTIHQAMTSNLLCHIKLWLLGLIPANSKTRVFQHISFDLKPPEMA